MRNSADGSNDAHPSITRGILSEVDLRRVQGTFRVSEEQVRRDHIISHVLAILSTLNNDRFIFFGGTALSRTLLPSLRLSEDIDLIAIDNRGTLAADIQTLLTSQLGRIIGRPSFEPHLARTRGSGASSMRIAGHRVEIQLISHNGYPAWPTEVVPLVQRYADAGSAMLRVPTPAAFAAAKLSAWHQRGAARDLYDLWALAHHGFIGINARRIFAQLGPLTDPSQVSFDRFPSESEWTDELAHQCVPQVSAGEAAEVVRAAWRQ